MKLVHLIVTQAPSSPYFPLMFTFMTKQTSSILKISFTKGIVNNRRTRTKYGWQFQMPLKTLIINFIQV
jgi:hypothetical protein